MQKNMASLPNEKYMQIEKIIHQSFNNKTASDYLDEAYIMKPNNIRQVWVYLPFEGPCQLQLGGWMNSYMAIMDQQGNYIALLATTEVDIQKFNSLT